MNTPDSAAAPLSVALADISPDIRESVGGKAANLAEMLAAGLPVPDGFCVTTTAYRQFLADTGIGAGLDAVAAADITPLTAHAATARDQILGTPLPRELVVAVTAAYENLVADGSAAVAVRSSSTAEDRPDASFAGQYDTYLEIIGVEAVLAAVRRCWASLWSDRAVRYRAAHDPDAAHPAIAVIVQRMVDAATAGVLYTANPVSGRRRETVVEATTGLGEAVVSGTVTPDHYVLPRGGAPAADSGCLTATQLTELAAIGETLERHFGAPQDIEWAYDHAGTFRLTQSRPITTLFPVPEHSGPDVRAYWSVNVYQGISRPFTPMGSYMIRERQRGMRQYMQSLGFSPDIVDVDGWLYWDITDGVRSPAKRPAMAAFVDSLAAPTGRLVEQLGADTRFPAVTGVDDIPPTRRRKRWERLVSAWLFPDIARGRVERDARTRLEAFVGPETATADQRLRFVESVHRDMCRIESSLPRYANTAGSLGPQLAGRLLGPHADANEINAVLRGVPDNPTTEMDLLLWDLATGIRAEARSRRLVLETPPDELAAEYLAGTLPEGVRRGVAEFLRRYGCRATSEIDFGLPRWSDDPEPIFAMLANYLRVDEPEHDAVAHFAATAAAAEHVLEQITSRGPRGRALVARFLLRRSRRLRGLREFPKLCLMRGFELLRAQLTLVGAELERAGTLADAHDIMFLDLVEARKALAGLDFRGEVARRLADYERECARPRVPSIVLSDGTVPTLRTEAIGRADLTGLAAAAGRATGRVRVVHDPADAEIEPGEILVAATTDPGWTPLFLTAAALVTETGGMISHGTTIAREYGIPAVVGVPDATRLLRSGELITVDGSAGTISAESRENDRDRRRIGSVGNGYLS